MQKYSVNQQLIQTLLSWVESGETLIQDIIKTIFTSLKQHQIIIF